MKSISEERLRSKKTKRLRPVRATRPEPYEPFDVNIKVEGLCALIPLGPMRGQELLENGVHPQQHLYHQLKHCLLHAWHLAFP